MKNKFIIIPNNLNNISYLRSVGITTFLFPIEEYSIGYSSFSVNEINGITGNKYLLINRILKTSEIDNLLLVIDKYQDIRGIFFEDIGVFEALKNHSYELISYQNHFNTNYHTINALLSLNINSVVIPNDITLDEIKDVINNTKKPLIPFIYGKTQIMYSRRNLVHNFNDNYNLNMVNPVASEEVSKIEFEFKDSNNGTVVYDNNYYNGTDIISCTNSDNVLYYMINLIDLSDNEVSEVINSLLDQKYDNLKAIKSNTNYGFLYRKTIYRVKKENV